MSAPTVEAEGRFTDREIREVAERAIVTLRFHVGAATTAMGVGKLEAVGDHLAAADAIVRAIAGLDRTVERYPAEEELHG